jgi:glutathione S-transferase
MKLIIGNKNYSSWSLRPWLLLHAFDLPFSELLIPLYRKDTLEQLARHTPCGKVPVLIDKDLTVWDSLAICEYVSEQYLNNRGWPSSVSARAEARAASAEMHSGFLAIRTEMPMNCKARKTVSLSSRAEKEVARVNALWSSLRAKYQTDGDGLCGPFGIADCMFAPVALRFRTYGISLSDGCTSYMNFLLNHPSVCTWVEAGTRETYRIDVEK